MPYQTQPYVALGLGRNVLSGVKQYVIEGRRLTTKHAFRRIADVMELPPDVSVRPVQTSYQRLFDLGDVVVTTKTDEVICKNIRPLSAFVEALRGDHPAVQKDLDDAAERQKDEQRFESLTEADLHDIVVFYPKYPRCIVDFFRDSVSSPFAGAMLNYKVKKNQFVRKGQTVATCGQFEIVSPHEGRIEFLGNRSAASVEWPETRKFDDPSVDQYCDGVGIGGFNIGAMIPASKINPNDFYAFAVRPTRHSNEVVDNDLYTSIRDSFDHGLTYKHLKNPYGSTFYHLVDIIVGGIKGASRRVELPDHVKDDPVTLDQIMKVWPRLKGTRASIARPNEFPV